MNKLYNKKRKKPKKKQRKEVYWRPKDDTEKPKRQTDKQRKGETDRVIEAPYFKTKRVWKRYIRSYSQRWKKKKREREKEREVLTLTHTEREKERKKERMGELENQVNGVKTQGVIVTDGRASSSALAPDMDGDGKLDSCQVWRQHKPNTDSMTSTE